MSKLATQAARLRRQLLEQGWTERPVCGGCGEATAPRDFALGGICKACDATRAEDYASRMRDELEPDGQPRVAPPAIPIDATDFDPEALL